MTTLTLYEKTTTDLLPPVTDVDWASVTRRTRGAPSPTCSHQPPVIHLMLDGSVSTTDETAATYPYCQDVPEGWRDEIAVAVRAMPSIVPACSACGLKQTPMVAVWHFDPHGPQDRAPTPLAGRGIDDVVSGIAAPARGTRSVLTYALGAVEEHIASDDERPMVFAVVSDFELFDSYPAGVYDRLANLPGAVHAVVLGGRAPEQLLRDRRVVVAELDARSGPGSVTAALLAGVCNRTVSL